MPPKKAKKISLNEFLETAPGSWADEMDELPSAPAMRSDDDQGHQNDRYGRRSDDFLASRPDRAALPPREDIPLPTQPPYTAFVGNLPFDLIEAELEEFFTKTKSVKIIKDRDDKPKGFGYVEFEDLDGLKDAISKSGAAFSGRTIRVSVAEAPKERSGFGGNDDSKFDNPWRRDGPLPDVSSSRDSSRRRFDGPRPDPLPSVSEDANDWRSSRPRAALPEPETPTGSMRKKPIGFGSDNSGAADRDEVWSKGSKFKPAEERENAAPANRFGSGRGRGDMGPPRDPVPEESDWRSSSRARPARDNTSPTGSTPPTPQMGRRKLELLPRSGNGSNVPSPLSSPKIGPTPPTSGSRSNPFGTAKPVDVTAKDIEITQKLEKDRELNRISMSRTSSRTSIERPISRNHTPPASAASHSQPPSSPPAPASKVIPQGMSANVRPAFSFANAAANKKKAEEAETIRKEETLAEKLGEVTI
ncbi:MAG: hypothetical protein NXY57DRAFT_1028620 [Lentinula lateritia]|uniref:RRM domain-containing protein n=1 Tax=Lentinula lateritia TaxID=40482 RepID=A0ABQ8VCH1_9AGAR|nr:MAG: hypothetical protein NXY57DRAFT_1028620 [Lentinula lateritia]KAJ4487444.1 hypothetical protein C8R41DRAFT_836768 [Lentinula lateritia]